MLFALFILFQLSISLQVLRLLHYLVKFGYYGNIRDIQELQKPLINLLNGKNDMPFVQEDEKGRHVLFLSRVLKMLIC